jgi:uncharacterized protein (DUF2249 family)
MEPAGFFATVQQVDPGARLKELNDAAREASPPQMVAASAAASNTGEGEQIMADEKKIVTLDVRQMPPWERHPTIHSTFDGLEVGETLKLVNDHEPKPLYYEFMAERPGQVEWTSEQLGPREWVAHIKKVA